MSTKTKEPKPVYKAKDDSEHATAKLAACRDEALDAGQAVNDAVRKLTALIGEAALTADGQPFTGLSAYIGHDYWRIADHWSGLPHLTRQYVSLHDCHIDFDRSHEPKLVVHIADRDDRSHVTRYMTIPVSDLYWSETEARKAYAVACRERLKELTERVEEAEQNATKRRYT